MTSPRNSGTRPVRNSSTPLVWDNRNSGTRPVRNSSTPLVRNNNSNIPLALWSAFFIFLIPPLLALRQLSQRSPKLALFFTIYLIFVNILTSELYQHDKKRSRIMGWRISERRLHFFELVGGWPAAFISQQLFRHKTRKVSYQAVFWLIVVVHALLCLRALT